MRWLKRRLMYASVWRLALMGLLSSLTAAAPAQAPPPPVAPIAWLWDQSGLPAWSEGHAAVLVQHIHLTGSQARLRPRLDSPPLSAWTRVTPVVHVEVSTVRPPVDLEKFRPLIIQAMVRAAGLSSSGWVQMDMEAHPSQRAFYRSLVQDIKAALAASAPTVQLSVTALAWWCRSAAWLDGLAADEIVPMVFRMGKDAALLRQIWLNSPHKLHPRCRLGVIGQAMQEPFNQEFSQRYRKIYVFDAKHWRTKPFKRP